MGFSERLKEAAMKEHGQAEGSSFMTRLMQGQITNEDYFVYLQVLSEIYGTMEDLLKKHLNHYEWVTWFELEKYMRYDQLQKDLTVWRDIVGNSLVCPSPETQARLKEYVDRINRVFSSSELQHLSVAHFYTRYLGDLSGGQMIKQMLLSRGFPSAGLNFYDFGALAPAPAKAAFKKALDRLGEVYPDWTEP
ncbi:MAG: biliverdin-producing heme oxygenase, partial [Bdellovibrionaceae bacterium]|nr:biliverdin-producing heme oxygenase [Pseudobdellovibrionaceae bacterium]